MIKEMIALSIPVQFFSNYGANVKKLYHFLKLIIISLEFNHNETV